MEGEEQQPGAGHDRFGAIRRLPPPAVEPVEPWHTAGGYALGRHDPRFDLNVTFDPVVDQDSAPGERPPAVPVKFGEEGGQPRGLQCLLMHGDERDARGLYRGGKLLLGVVGEVARDDGIRTRGPLQFPPGAGPEIAQCCLG